MRPLLAACVVVTGLHLGVIWYWQSPPLVQGHEVWSTLKVRVSVRSPDQAKALELPKALRESDAMPESPLPLPMADPAPGHEQAGAPSPAKYLTPEQVDHYPHPVNDWVLDTHQPLPPGGWQVTVQLWVAADGHIDHVNLLNAQPSGEWAARLLAPVSRTEMVPAQLAGQGVPLTYVVQIAPDQLM